jgi:exodeoxyribonuclease VII large subunit
VQHLAHRLEKATSQQISSASTKLNLLNNSLIQLDPHAVLQRGYSMTLDQDGKLVRDASQLQRGTALQLNFARGSAEVTVDRVVATREAD